MYHEKKITLVRYIVIRFFIHASDLSHDAEILECYGVPSLAYTFDHIFRLEK